MEPPGDPNGQQSAGTGGVGGVGGMSAGTGGFGNPTGGVGGTGGASGAEAGGMGGGPPIGGTGAGAGGMGAGMGGAGGVAGFGGEGGTGGAISDGGADDDGEAPMMECEDGRDTVEVTIYGAPVPHCVITATDDVLTHSEAFAVAITMADGDETMWPKRKEMSDPCGEEQAFFFDGSLDVPRIELCPKLCEALVAAQPSGVTVELIYGCPPP